MTRDEILNMPAGREMDALVAEKVMEWTRPPSGRGWNVTTVFRRVTPDKENLQVAWVDDGIVEFSTDISAAWEVVEKLRLSITQKDLKLFPECYKNSKWLVDIEPKGKNDLWIAYAETAPLAICRAALLVVINP